MRITAKVDIYKKPIINKPIEKELIQITGLKCFGQDNETLEEVVLNYY